MKAAPLRSHNAGGVLPTMLENCQSIKKKLIYLTARNKALGHN
jgi:hypothetical protein